MFCSNCGKDCGDANFCSNCGTKLNVQYPPPADPPKKTAPKSIYQANVNGHEINLLKVVGKYGANTPRVYSYLKREYGVSKEQAMEILAPFEAQVVANKPSHKNLFAETKTAAQEMIEAANAARQYERQKGYVSAQTIASSPETFDVDKLAWYPGKKKNERKAKIAELEKSGQVYCPKCLSTSISANQKGFGFARGAVGAAIGLDVGLIAGGIGSKKVICTCLKCGYQWKAGKK